MYQVTAFPSGLTIATGEMPHMASVCLGIWVGVGGRHEPAELNGASHFIEHLLFKGTRKRNAKKISQDVEGAGGYLNAFTSEEYTCFYSKARHDRCQDLLEVLLDMFLHSTFDPVEIEKERNVIKEELAMYQDQPQQYVQELLNETLWPGHPLGRSLTGTEETLDAMGRAQLLRFKHAHYVTGSTLLVAAGNISHRKLIRMVSRYVPRFRKGPPPKFRPIRCRQSKASIRLFTKKTEQTQLALGIRTCSRHDERQHALRLLNTILGDNMSSRLFQRVREDHGLAYSIGSCISFFQDVGTLDISAGVDTDKLPQTLEIVIQEMKRLTEKAPPLSELRRARDYLVGQMDLNLENTENQMMWIGETLLGHGHIIRPATVKNKLARIKPNDIRKVANDFFLPDRLNLALVSPMKSDRGLMDLIKM